MTLLGTLLKNRRRVDAQSAWNRTNLQGPEILTVTSRQFGDGGPIPHEHTGRRIGGKNLSPQLAWSPLPGGTTRVLIVVEDLDVPLRVPAVHCLVLVDPSRLDTEDELPPGALSGKAPGAGVHIRRSTVGRGYQGPEPIKGHGPHRYTFQAFALSGDGVDEARMRPGPRALLSAVNAPVIARGRLIGTYER